MFNPNLLIKILTNYLNQHEQLKNSRIVPIVVSSSHNKNHGHYNSNLAMIIAKHIKKNPLEIAKNIEQFLWKKERKYFEKIEIAKPGFLNFYIKQNFLCEIVQKAVLKKENYGRGAKKAFFYNLELISANPTGLLHIGHARNGCIGDSVARILKFSGYKVLTDHYTNDAGKQIEHLALTVFIYYLRLATKNKAIPLLDVCYKGNCYDKLAQAIYQEKGKAYLNIKYDNVLGILDHNVKAYFAKTALNYFLNILKQQLIAINVKIDEYVSEKEQYESGAIANTLAILKTKKVVYQTPDKALWLKTTAYDDEKDRVLIKSNQEYTYLLPDVAAHIQKIKRNQPDAMIDFWGADHHSYAQRMKIALAACGYPNVLIVDLIQMVQVVAGAKKVKMSKRMGTAVTIEEIVKMIGVDALRYTLCSSAASSHMTIDVAVLQEKSANNPVYYIKYAIARLKSIFNNAFSLPNEANWEGLLLTLEGEIDLILMVGDFSGIVRVAGQKRAPYLLCEYLYKLAKKFHSYYNSYKINDPAQPALSQARLALGLSVFYVLKNGLGLLGINPFFH